MKNKHHTQRWIVVFLLISPIFLLFFASASAALPQIPATTSSPISLPLVLKSYSAAADPEAAYRLYGLNFSPFMDGQDPNLGSQVSEAQIRERLALVAPYTRWVRSFGCGNGLEVIGPVAHEMNLKVAVNAWLGRDLASNEHEIECLIDAAQAGNVDLAVIGSETLIREDLTEEQLVQYLRRVRQAVPADVPVTTADVYSELHEHPAVAAASDVLFANIYPYWEGLPLDYSIPYIHFQYQRLAALGGGKPVLISEAGWPSCGDPVGEAQPSPDSASGHFLDFTSWARANHISYFYFEAFDETWKAAYEGPQGSCWGIWDKEGELKAGMQAVFDGETVADYWSDPPVPGGPGEPAIEFTYVPEYNSQEDLQGQVLHVKPADLGDYKVVVYIRIGSAWWVKPYASSPATEIRFNGDWTCDITTGGVDPTANRIVAYLVPESYSPPVLLGSMTLPPELEGFPKAEVDRTPLSDGQR